MAHIKSDLGFCKIGCGFRVIRVWHKAFWQSEEDSPEFSAPVSTTHMLCDGIPGNRALHAYVLMLTGGERKIPPSAA